MRDNTLLPLALVLLLIGGFAYLPQRSASPTPSRAAADTPNAAQLTQGSATAVRTEVQLVGDHFGIDVARELRLRAVSCAAVIVESASADERQQLQALMTTASGKMPADKELKTAIDVELHLAGSTDRCPAGVSPAAFLTEYLGTDHEAQELQLLADRLRDRAEVEFVLAMLPDPIDSNGRWQFDPLAEALQNAVGQSGYVLDRFTLPDWDPAGDPERRAPSSRHEREPGTILFRRAVVPEDGPQHLLAMFLVYETATAGAHHAALRHAIDAVARWEEIHGREPLVRVLGPTYSGSIPSLQQAFRAGFEQHPKMSVRIVSGGATAYGNKRQMEHIPGVPAGRVTYHATVLPDRRVFPVLIEAVQEMQGPGSVLGPAKVALLLEGNTSFGMQAGSETRKTRISFTELPFPLHISRLRSVASRERGADKIAPPSRFLPLSLEDPITPVDQVPALSPRSTSADIELVLANILSTIRREGFTGVGILATDTRDKLFLAQQMAQFSPDVTVFTTEPDLLFTHPDYRRYTRGIVVGSTYPLFNSVQPLTASAGRRLQFVSSNAEGVYNAAIALLNYDSSGRPNAPDVPELLDYASPDDPSVQRPPVWISVAGRDALWPLRYESVPDPDRILHPYSRPPGTAVATAPPNVSPWVVGLMVCIVAVAWYHVYRTFRPRETGADPGLLGYARYAAQERIDESSPYLLVCLAALVPLVVGALVLAIPRLRLGVAATPATSRWIGSVGWWLLASLLASAAVGLVLAAMTRIGPRAWTRLAGATSTTVCRWLTCVGAALAVSTIVAAGEFLYVTLTDPARLRTFVERAGHPVNGVSPTIPVVLLSVGLYLWAAAQLRRLWYRSKAEAITSDTAPGYATVAEGQLVSGLQSLMAVVRHPVSEMGSGVRQAAYVASAAAALLILLRGGSTVEHWSLGAAFLLTWTLTEGLVLLWLAHVYDLWRRLRFVLRVVAVDDLGPAFGRVPRELFVDRFAVNFPGPRQVRRIINEARALLGGIEDVGGGQAADGGPPPAAVAAAVSAALKLGDPALLVSAEGIGGMGGPAVNVTVTTPASAPRSLPSWQVQAQHELARVAAAGDPEPSGTGNAGVPPTQEHTWDTVVKATGQLYVALKAPALQARLRRALRPGGDGGSLADRWVERAEMLVVMPVAVVVREMAARVTQALFLATAGVLLMVAFLASIPVQSRQTLVGIAWLDVFTLSGVALAVFIQADRDELLSRMTGTDPGRVTWDAAFLTKLLLYVGLPLLTLFVSQFPELTDSLGRWLAPIQPQLP